MMLEKKPFLGHGIFYLSIIQAPQAYGIWVALLLVDPALRLSPPDQRQERPWKTPPTPVTQNGWSTKITPFCKLCRYGIMEDWSLSLSDICLDQLLFQKDRKKKQTNDKQKQNYK